MFILVIIIFIIILKKELPGLLKKQSRHDLAAFICITVFAFVLCLLLVFVPVIPSPVMPIYNFIKDIYGGLGL